MGPSSSLNKAKSAGSRIRETVDKAMSHAQVSSSIRESRHGYRGLGMFQLWKYYSSEGVHVIDIGGPPVVGK